MLHSLLVCSKMNSFTKILSLNCLVNAISHVLFVMVDIPFVYGTSVPWAIYFEEPKLCDKVRLYANANALSYSSLVLFASIVHFVGKDVHAIGKKVTRLLPKQGD